MERTVEFRRLRGWFAWVAGCLLLLGGCVYTAPVARQPADEPTEDVGVTGEATGPAATVAHRPLVILLNDPTNSYRELVEVFSARLGRPYEIQNLAHRPEAAVRERLGEIAPLDVIAIGSAGYRVATEVPRAAVYYAGVLNPVQGGVGLDALPSFDAQLDYWQSRSSDLERIGVIGSRNAAGTIARLAEACAGRELSLEKATVASDAEFLMVFRRMVPRIDGFILLPDGEVLSPEVIRGVVSHGRQNGVQTLVYSPFMFKLGANLLVQRDQVEMALALIELLQGSSTITGLSRIRVTDRLGTAGQLSLVTAGTVLSVAGGTEE